MPLIYTHLSITPHMEKQIIFKKKKAFNFQFYFVQLNIIFSDTGTKCNCCVVIHKTYLYYISTVIDYDLNIDF